MKDELREVSAPPIGAATKRKQRWRRIKWPPWFKYLLALAFAIAWVSLSIWLAVPWVADLKQYVGGLGAWVIVTLVALIPGFVVALMGMSLTLDRQPPLRSQDPKVPITVIIAAHNEEAGIAITIERIVATDYAGPVKIILAANNCTDETVPIAIRTAEEIGADLTVVTEPTPGKSHALNTALRHVDTEYVLTVDADTLLHRQALRRLVSRMETGPGPVAAVAGSVLARNSRVNLLTRMQEWDYWIGISAVKRMQGMYSATLVAQGAFSIYRTEQVRQIGGWPDAIGEDIVVTWKLMQDGSRVLFEPTAVSFTDVPENVGHFMKQRSRWARGMFEGLNEVPPWRQSKVLARLVAAIDLLIPFLDIGYALLWLPGLVLALFGIPAIVGIWTLLVFPITTVMYGILRHYQSSRVFGPLGLHVRRNRIGYIAFLFTYQAFCSIASLQGYLQFFTKRERVWK